MCVTLFLCNTKAKLEIKQNKLQEKYTMKKYTSRVTKWAAFSTIIGMLALVVGIVLMIIKLSDIGVEFTSIGGAISTMSLLFYFGEKSRWLTIDDSKVDLPRGASINGKIAFERTVIKIDEIVSVEREFHKGDGITIGSFFGVVTPADCFINTIKLKDNTEIVFNLYTYGKKAENEIIETLRKSIR